MNENNPSLGQLSDLLLLWYESNKRDLPWRHDISGYRTWVSEIMLQQTRVTAVIPYFERFMMELPTVQALANVDQEHLMKLWEGLGYYSRARNLQAAAKIVTEQYNGNFPETYEELLCLPGIGDYTAGAISSIVFGQNVPAVDGNVLRVFSRLMNSSENILDEKVKRNFRSMIQEILPKGKSGMFNQAVMDLGAMICLPNGQPLCSACPLSSLCLSHCQNNEMNLPVRIKKGKRKVEEKTVFLLVKDQRVAVNKRPDQGLLSSLWEYPNTEGLLSESVVSEYLNNLGIEIHQWLQKRTFHHLFSHVRWDMDGYILEVSGTGLPSWQWVSLKEWEEKAIPSAFETLSTEVPMYLKEKKHDM